MKLFIMHVVLAVLVASASSLTCANLFARHGAGAGVAIAGAFLGLLLSIARPPRPEVSRARNA